MKKLNQHQKYWLSGEKAKSFRRNLSAWGNSRNKIITQSHKFPLMVEPLSEAARDTLRQEYYLSSAVAENTLFHYFVSVHLSGFRIFSSEGAAEIYHNKLILRQSRLDKDLKEALGVEGEPAASLLQELKKDIRKGKTKEKVIAKIERVHSFKAKEKETLLDQFVQELATEITDNKLWKKNQEQQRCEAIITAGKKLGFNFTLPTLQPYKYPVLWSDQTAEYLKDADTSATGLEFAMHQLVSFAAHIARGAKVKVTEDDIKTVLLSDTDKYNGLSSFFNPNKGMQLFAATKEQQLSEQLEIGRCESKKLQNIRNIAKTLLEHKINFAKHRSLFGGNIASSVSNYWKRLEELQGGLKSIACSVAPEIAKTLTQLEQTQEKFVGITAEYEQIAVSAEHLQALIDDLIQQKQTAENALQRLMGESDKIAGKQEIECIEEFNDCFEESKGLFIQLAEKIRTKAGDKKGEYKKARELFNTLEFLLPPQSKQQDEIEDGSRYLKRKINRYSGAKIYELSEIKETLTAEYAKLKHLQQARAKHWQKIIKKYPIDIIAVREKTERQRIGNNKSKNINEYNPLDLACRNILQRLADAVKKLGDRTNYAAGELLFEKCNVFANKKEGASFFRENKGRIYVSAFAEYSHEKLTLGRAFDENIRSATEKFITAFFAWAKTIQKDNNAEAIRDAALAEQAMYALSCSGVSQEVPTTLARPDESCELEIPAGLQQALKKETVNSGELGRIFNAYASEINGLCARLVRRQIIVKSRLQHIDDKDFYYLPKADRDFTPPQKLFNNDGAVQGDSPLARTWRILQTEKILFVDNNPIGKAAKIKASALPAALDLLKDNLEQEEGGAHILRTCLRQIPHSWYYKNSEYPTLKPMGEEKNPRLLDQDGQKLCGLWRLEKGITLKKTKKADSDSMRYLRLSGTSRHKGWLDNVLLGRASFGDSSLIIEEEYRQQYDKKGPIVEYNKTRVEIAAVFKTPAPTRQEQEFLLKDYFIAIDLGERGIGYSVYKVPEAGNNGKLQQPIISGHVVLPILRRLMKRVDNYRRRQQPRQRFQTNINTALQQLREVTIGELAGTIDGLMNKYKAFPVFESSVGGFESGGRALKMVYGSILHLYSFSDVDAHKTKRQNHWQATKAPTWKHPNLKRLDRKGAPELSLFPGVVVSPAGTSQTCSVCEENPLTLIEDEIECPLSTDSNGILTLPEAGEKLYIYGYTKHEKKSEKYNSLPTTDGLLKNHSFKNKKELLKHVKKMLRHKPLSKKSKDTSQSSYLSPFVSTQKKLAQLSKTELKKQHYFRPSYSDLIFMHADVNAAINIGKKWWDKINKPEAKKKAKK